MEPRIIKFDGMRVQKKVIQIVPKRIPKREVASSDIRKKLIEPKVEITKEPTQVLPKSVARHFEQIFSTKPVRPKSFFLAYALSKAIPMLLIFTLITGVIQAGAYLNRAKAASGIVLGSATSAYEELDSANESLNNQDFNSAKNQFSEAQRKLASAQSELDNFKLLTALAPQAKGADNVLTGAYFLAEAGKNLTRAMQLFDELRVDSTGVSTENFTSKLEQNHNLLKNSLLMLSYAKEKFNNASGMPGEYAETLEQAKSQIELLNTLLTDLVNLEDLYLSFFGTQPRTYLLAFQNYDEMRATGGFIGTYGVLKYENGEIKKLKIESIYNLDGSLTKNIAAPGPFQPDIEKWGMRDSNWFADFPTSAKKLLQFYEMESETADGIVAITPQLFEDILKLVGPIEMTQYDVTLTPENFQDVVQTKTSKEYDKELNQPKKFLDDFAPILLNRMSDLKKEQWFTMFQIMKDNFAKKHILVYSADQDIQKKISNLGFDGKIIDAPHDYLSIINSNHGGTKTDLDVEQSVNLESRITTKGEIINTIKISRANSSTEVNKNFMRVLVPFGSRLIGTDGFMDKEQLPSTAEGFETDPHLAEWDKSQRIGNAYVRSEANKTSFTGWMETAGNSTSVLTLKYVLPIKVETSFFNRSQSHSLIFQKQAGNKNTKIDGSWILDDKNVKWVSGNANKSSNKATFSTLGETDESWGMVISR